LATSLGFTTFTLLCSANALGNAFQNLNIPCTKRLRRSFFAAGSFMDMRGVIHFSKTVYVRVDLIYTA